MSNKEKYIKYIMDEIIGETKVDYPNNIVAVPFPTPFTYDTVFGDDPINAFTFLSFKGKYMDFNYKLHYLKHLPEYLAEKYGVMGDEVDIIMRQYSKRIKHILDNE